MLNWEAAPGSFTSMVKTWQSMYVWEAKFESIRKMGLKTVSAVLRIFKASFSV